MIYRFLSKLATLERLEAFPVPIPGKHKEIRAGVGIVHYEKKMTQIAMSPEIEGVSCYQAPRFDTRPTGLCLRFHEGKETEVLPDIWGAECELFISEKVKKVIESIDDFEHEYIPIQWIDHNEQPLETEQAYYWLNLRRFLSITPSVRTAKAEELGYFPLDVSEDFIARVKDTPKLQTELEQVPIWRHVRQGIEWREHGIRYRAIVYFNQELVDALRAEKVIGMDLFSQKYGLGEESLCEL
ncbi:imm11 family protein [Litoribacillus peritrichatus]|uniref:Immunity MXAN-0049 protein domain-containing protein n=1 Tax=Litoribacillus peritrichatus TaxID=718191 RepID=A0ABP7ME95_9GAMM